MNDEDLVRLLDRLEDAAESYVTLEDVEAAIAGGHGSGNEIDLAQAIADDVVLIDLRQRVDGSSVTLCRLNRHHPLVARLTSW